MENTIFKKSCLFSVDRPKSPEKANQQAGYLQNGKKAFKSLALVGVYIVLNNLALEYMTGEELLNYLKGYAYSIADSVSPLLNAKKIENNIPTINKEFALNPAEFVKKVHSLLNKKAMAKAA